MNVANIRLGSSRGSYYALSQPQRSGGDCLAPPSSSIQRRCALFSEPPSDQWLQLSMRSDSSCRGSIQIFPCNRKEQTQSLLHPLWSSPFVACLFLSLPPLEAPRKRSLVAIIHARCRSPTLSCVRNLVVSFRCGEHSSLGSIHLPVTRQSARITAPLHQVLLLDSQNSAYPS